MHKTSQTTTRNTKKRSAQHARAIFGSGRPGWRVVQFGSNANNAANAGTFYWNLNNDSANEC